MKDSIYLKRIQGELEKNFVEPHIMEYSASLDGNMFVDKTERLTDSVTLSCGYTSDGRFISAKFAIKDERAEKINDDSHKWMEDPAVSRMVWVRRGSADEAFEVSTYYHDAEAGKKVGDIVYFGDLDGTAVMYKDVGPEKELEYIGETSIDTIIEAVGDLNLGKIINYDFKNDSKQI